MRNTISSGHGIEFAIETGGDFFRLLVEQGFELLL